MITSTHNSKLQLVRSLLGRPKERRQSGAFVAEGVRLVEEALAVDWPFRFVLAGDDLSPRGQELITRLQQHGVDVEFIPQNLMSTIGETEATQGILAVLDPSPLLFPKTISFALILDQVRDPGNLGTLLRTAVAAGVQVVLLTPGTTDAYAPKVVRAGMGAHFRLPIFNMTWEQIRSHTHDLSVLLADMEGTPCWQADLTLPLALVIGGEAEGSSPEVLSLVNSSLAIPMPGEVESLNAAVAGSILMFEVVRQRAGR